MLLNLHPAVFGFKGYRYTYDTITSVWKEMDLIRLLVLNCLFSSDSDSCIYCQFPLTAAKLTLQHKNRHCLCRNLPSVLFVFGLVNKQTNAKEINLHLRTYIRLGLKCDLTDFGKGMVLLGGLFEHCQDWRVAGLLGSFFVFLK